MNRYWAVMCVIGLATLGGCGLPAPAQYDDAMLRDYFGKSPEDVEATFGKPDFQSLTEAPPLPQNATAEERTQFDSHTEVMSYQYSTADGDLEFHFNLNREVFAITYLGRGIAPENSVPQ